ncbi:MAG: hypothetical protein FJ143_16300 [Deltaproteobacteria bacterium]|nr:hypothetical protein [Deltaproteobacteria bacterium]
MLRQTAIRTLLRLAMLALAASQMACRSQEQAADGLAVVKAYLQANYARNFAAAYRHVSSADRQIRSEASYVQSQGPYRGFALEAASKLAGQIEIWLLEQQGDDRRRRVKVGYRLPAPADLAGLLLNWDEAALDALARDRQKQILAELDARKRAGRLLFVEGQETFELVKEQNAWKIFFQWAAATTVKLKIQLSIPGALDVRFAENEVMAKDDELFLVNLAIKNRTARALTFTVGHHLDPVSVGENLQLVECGLLAPVTLLAGREQEFSMAYLLTGAARQNHREISLTYEFKVK